MRTSPCSRPWPWRTAQIRRPSWEAPSSFAILPAAQKRSRFLWTRFSRRNRLMWRCSPMTSCLCPSVPLSRPPGVDWKRWFRRSAELPSMRATTERGGARLLVQTTRSLSVIALLICASLVLSAAQAPEPNPAKPAFRDGVVLVGFNAGVKPDEIARVLSSVGARELRVIGQDVHVVRVPARGVEKTIEALHKSPLVRYAEPDFRHSLNAAPNDPSLSQQWAINNTGQRVNGVTGTLGADERTLKAWNVTTGSRSVVVAVVDTGIDYKHPDFAANVWSNPGGINGCPAGTHGYNVLAQTCDPMDDDSTFNGHGTHVAGIIGASGNNGVGVAGINWQTTLLGEHVVAIEIGRAHG